ncbi:hypothetical protein [Sphingomicrobium aestuariivivum]|uniref:hypothetical protein n=1 Tax=Sphingomicrobium aestuariivivum TaxID=1582356 RepID=UPI001FD68AEF|nr:hypothetical protein [Sphingomicrobium aestuariivivum]MCJ8191680.1 hypothetical protein [Sphingomicrobium aestuariivivum]
MFLFAALVAAPAQATQGIACTATDDSGVVISLGAGTIPAPTWWASEKVDGEWRKLGVAMHWIDDEVIRMMFVAEDGMSRAGELRAARAEDWIYEGELLRGGQAIPMRCQPD